MRFERGMGKRSFFLESSKGHGVNWVSSRFTDIVSGVSTNSKFSIERYLNLFVQRRNGRV